MSVFNFTITIGTTEYDVTQYVEYGSIKKSTYLFKDLKPNTDTLQFQLSRDFPQLGQLLAYSGNVLAQVTKDSNPYFTGYLTKDYQTSILAATGLTSIPLTIEDPGIVKLKRAWVSSDTVSTQYPGYNICDQTDTAHSVVHLIGALAGVTISSSAPQISKLIYLSIKDSDKKTYWDVLATILFEFGYVFHFLNDGTLNIYSIVQSSITPTANLATNTNIRGKIQIQKALKQYDQANVSYKQWEWHDETENYLIYDETSGRNSAAKECYQFLSLSAGYPYYQPGSTTLTQSGGTPRGTSDPNPKTITYYDVRNGKEIIFVKDITIDYVDTRYVDLLTLQNLSKTALINIKANTTSFLKRVKIYGQGVMVNGGGSSNVYNTVTSQGGGQTVLEYKAEYANTKEDAQTLANLLQQYYKYSIFSYSFLSSVSLDIGQVINIQDPAYLGLDINALVIQKTSTIQYSNGTPDEAVYSYVVIGTGEFDTSLPVDLVDNSSSSTTSQIGTLPTYETLDDGTLTVSGSIGTNGLVVASGSLKSANYVAGTTGYSINPDGTFEFNKDSNNRFFYDASNYTFKGNLIATSGELQTLSVTGAISLATGGTITGGGFSLGPVSSTLSCLTATATKLYLGTGTYGNANTAFYVDNLGQFSLKDKLTWNGTTLAINGSVTSVSGTIAAFTLASNTISATNLVLTSGAANTASIVVGSGSFAGGLNSASLSTDILFWGGASFANRATAPFRVNAKGEATATAGTFGAVTLGNGKLYIGAGNYANADTGFFVDNTSRFSLADKLYYDGAGNLTITGVLNAVGGSAVAGWLTTATQFKSASTGQRLELDSSLSRISVIDSTNTTVTALGFLNGLPKNSGIGNWGVSDYGIYVKSGNTLVIDGAINNKNGDLITSDASIKIQSSGADVLRLGTDSAIVGLHLYNANGAVRLYNSGADSLTIKSDSGYGLLGAQNASWFHFYTDRPAFYFDKPVSVNGAISVYNTSYGLDATGKARFLSGTGTDSNTVYTKDSNGQVKERTIQSGVWTYNTNQNLNTTDSPSFLGVNVTGNTGLYQSRTLNETALTGTSISLWGSGTSNNYQIRGHNIFLSTTGNMAVTHGIYADVRGAGEGDWGRTVGFEAFMGGSSTEQFGFVTNADNYFQGTTVSRAFVTKLNDTTINNISFTATPATTGGSIPIGTYYYTITAIDTFGGETTRLQYAQATTTTATSKVTLSWNAVLGATSYKIYRNNSVSMHFSSTSYIGTTTGTSLIDTLSSPTTGFPKVYGVTGVLNIIDGTKAQFGVPTKIADATASTSSTTGALVINGGVGVAGDMNVAGNLTVGSINITSSNLLPVGSLVMFAGSSVPTNFLLCNGQAVSRSTYSALFSAIGTTWGAGNGSTTFNVPDLVGAAPSGVGTSVGYTQNETIALGTKYNDQMQGHRHYLSHPWTGGVFASGGGQGFYSNSPSAYAGEVLDPINDTTNGTPRTGNVTRGKRVGINFIIKAF